MQVLIVSRARHGLSKGGEISHQAKQTSISAGRVGSFFSGFEQETIPVDALFLLLAVATCCRPKELLALRRQDIAPPNRHTMKHWSLLISTSWTNARSKTGLQDTCVTLDSVDASPTEARHGAGHRNTQRNTFFTFELPVSPILPRGEPWRKTIQPGRLVLHVPLSTFIQAKTITRKRVPIQNTRTRTDMSR